MKILHIIIIILIVSCKYNENPGSKSASFLDKKTYENLVVEVHYSSKSAIPGTAIRDVIEELNKDFLEYKNIKFDIDDKPIPSELVKKQYYMSDLIEIEKRVRKYHFDLKTQTASIFFVYLEGEIKKTVDDKKRYLGMAFSGSSIVILKDKIDNICRPRILKNKLNAMAQEHYCDVAESNILIHEIGHLLGLVNQPIKMVEQHEDKDHPGHDVNPNCLMHYKYDPNEEIFAINKLVLDKQDVNQAVLSIQHTYFCDQCKNDLKVSKSKFAD